MFCNKCGKAVIPEAKFCTNCGGVIVGGHVNVGNLDAKPGQDAVSINSVTGTGETRLWDDKVSHGDVTHRGDEANQDKCEPQEQNFAITTPDNAQILSLETVRAVWEIELKDIDSRVIGGQDPNSRMNKVDEAFVNIQKKTGLSESTQKMLLATFGNVTGTSGLILAGVALAAGLDGADDQKTLKNGEITQKLLALSNRPISSIDWDTLSSLIGNVESWLLPILAKRIESLSEILQIKSNPLAKERLDLYLRAIEELGVALATLKRKANEFNEGWARELSIYNQYAQQALNDYEAEKRQLALENGALLIDKTEFVNRSHDIEDKYASKICSMSGCKNISALGSHYCFQHKCFSPSGCANHVVKGLHYCDAHVRNLGDVQIQLPSLKSKWEKVADSEHDNSRGAHGSSKISESDNQFARFSKIAIFACVTLLVVGLATMGILSAKNVQQKDPAPAPAEAPLVQAETCHPPLPAPAVTPPSPDNQIKSEMMDKFDALHNTKSYAEWGEEDMVLAVNIIAHPETDNDKQALIEAENFTLKLECSTGSCIILQRELEAAKKIREGKAKTAQEALGLGGNPPDLALQPHQQQTAEPQQISAISHVIDSMINAARIDDMSSVIAAKETLYSQSKPNRGNRKVARLKNKDGLAALNAGNYKGAVALLAEGSTADPGDIELMNNLGYALMMDGQLDAAKAKLVDVLSLDIARSGAWANVGEVYAKMGSQVNAVAGFKLSYFFSSAPEKTIDFFKKLSETDADEKIRNAASKAVAAFSNVQPMLAPQIASTQRL